MILADILGLGLDSLLLQLPQRFHAQHHLGGILARHGIRHLQLLPQFFNLSVLFLHLGSLLFEPLLESIDAAHAEFATLRQTVLSVFIRHRIGDACRLFLILAENLDLDQAGIADRGKLNALEQQRHGLESL
ncbi:hypothetical protein SDC9_187467 [bioreactor metagenome]|uniref:Uncharacterized protein n=1 Tax=bioreactor metagenome TaxID=1076179 RepID=A0A645HX69_9ZZZZ